MNKLSKYNDFITEKEFQKVVFQIYKLVESTYTQEWDLTNDTDTVSVGDEIEWSFDQKSKLQRLKDNISKLKTNIYTFKKYLNEPDPEVEIKFEHPLINIVKEFLSKLKDKEEVKKYFLKILDEVKSLPYPIKKKLLIRISFIFLSYVSLSDITPPDVIAKEPLMAEVKIELQKEIPSKKEVEVKSKEVKSKEVKSKEVKSKEVKGGSKFEIAQVGVHKIEGVYTADRDDKGNWTGNEVGSGMLLGTKFGISAPTLVKYYNDNDLGTPNQQNMMDLTYKTALDIYKIDYWEAQQLSNFKSQSLANVLYDGCVNQGPGATLKILTNSLEGINVDTTGVDSWNNFHEDLIDEVNELSTSEVKKLFHLIKNKRWEKYQLGKKKYQEGWKNRLDAITFNDDNDDKNIDIS